MVGIVGIGHALLDVLVKDQDDDLLTKFGLKSGDCLLSDEKRAPLFDVALERRDAVCAGGAVANTLRVAQYLWPKDEACCHFFGSIGKGDTFGELFKSSLKRHRVGASLCESEGTDTGVCVCVVREIDGDRSMVTRLEAAKCSLRDLLCEESSQEVLRNAQIVYFVAYFLNSVDGFATVQDLIKICVKNTEPHHHLAFGLGATFLIESFRSEMDAILPFCSLVFANEEEATAFAKVRNWDVSSVEDIATKISGLPKENQRGRIVVVTRGGSSVIVAENGSSFHVQVPQVDKVVDCTGAGDSFTAAFLVKLLEGNSIRDSVVGGIDISQRIIQALGCDVEVLEVKK